jgi:hypothetical protein
LARRVLHFSANQLFWECNQLTASENHPDGMPGSIRGGRSDLLRRIEDLKALKPPVSQELVEQERLVIWGEILAVYSRKKLTKKRDKIPAIWGVVKFLQTAFDDACVAGLWRRDLHRYLGWFCVDRHESLLSMRSRPYRAPTWSWASTDNVVSIENTGWFEPKRVMKILAIDPTPGGTGTEVGHACDHELVVQGPLNKLVAYYWGPMTFFIYLTFEDGNKPAWELKWDEPFAGLDGDAEETPSGPKKDVYTMPLYIYRHKQWGVDHIRYLLLTPVDGRTGRYKRVGIADAQLVEEWTSAKFLKVSNGQSSPCEEYLGEDDGHRIRIV